MTMANKSLSMWIRTIGRFIGQLGQQIVAESTESIKARASPWLQSLAAARAA
jgi:hypothetical protein